MVRLNARIGIVVGAALFAITLTAAGWSTNTSGAQPAVTGTDDSFYQEGHVDAAWADATAQFPNPLPAGVDFPKDAPRFFHPDDGKQYQFSADLFGEIAARFWRCSWLKVSLDTPAEQLDSASNNSNGVEVQRQLSAELWKSVPQVERNMDVDAYIADMKSYAARSNTSPELAEYLAECHDYTETTQ
jgi:hypothetical protein